jgi:hypothetical protein
MEERAIFAIQFHPEVSHTPRGGEILNRFLFEICDCQPDWEMGSFVNDAVRAIRERVGDREAICAVSGGVDSSVAAALVGTAIGSKLHRSSSTMGCIAIWTRFDRFLISSSERPDLTSLGWTPPTNSWNA